MFSNGSLKKLLSENYPLLSLLIGVTLVSFSIGPFQNADTDWEFQAATGVLKYGMPYVNTVGNVMNQPPLGFYVEALFFKIFGASINTGTVLVTLFGLGSTILVYLIGKKLYGKTTGLFAAALFALSPWELFLTRSFLIDAQCLFFSLLCLFFGVIAIQKNSSKYSLISGVFFAAALLTKYFAVFILIPLLLFYVYSRPKNLKLILTQIIAFLLPALLFSFLWYQVVLGKGLMYVFQHGDFSDLNYSGVIPSYSFVGSFLWNYGLGVFLVITLAFSLVVYFSFWKEFPKLYIFDLICLAIVSFIAVLDTILGVSLNLKAPYNNAIKYNYQALPFFCFIASSLVGKCLTLNSKKVKTKLRNKLIFIVTLTSAVLFGAVIFVDVGFAHLISSLPYLLFKVQIGQDVGYSLFNYTPTTEGSLLMGIQYVGFAILLSGFLWASKHTILNYSNRLAARLKKTPKPTQTAAM